MAESTPILRKYGNVDVQPGGPGNNWYYLSACATMSGPSVPEGDVDVRLAQQRLQPTHLLDGVGPADLHVQEQQLPVRARDLDPRPDLRERHPP